MISGGIPTAEDIARAVDAAAALVQTDPLRVLVENAASRKQHPARARAYAAAALSRAFPSADATTICVALRAPYPSAYLGRLLSAVQQRQLTWWQHRAVLSILHSLRAKAKEPLSPFLRIAAGANLCRAGIRPEEINHVGLAKIKVGA